MRLMLNLSTLNFHHQCLSVGSMHLIIQYYLKENLFYRIFRKTFSTKLFYYVFKKCRENDDNFFRHFYIHFHGFLYAMSLTLPRYFHLQAVSSLLTVCGLVVHYLPLITTRSQLIQRKQIIYTKL